MIFVGENLNLALWQWLCLWCTCCEGSFDKNISNEIGPCTIFARFDHIWLLSFPKAVDCFEELHFFRFFNIQEHVLTMLNSIPERFHQCSEQYIHSLTKCIWCVRKIHQRLQE